MTRTVTAVGPTSKAFIVVALLTGLIVLTSCATVEEKPTASPAPVSAPEAPSVTEGVAAMAECLKQKGWEVQTYRDGYAFPGPAEQLDVYLEDQMACYSELGFDKPPPARMDDEHLTAMYGQEQQLRDCLMEQGYDPPELPSM